MKVTVEFFEKNVEEMMSTFLQYVYWVMKISIDAVLTGSTETETT